MTNIATRPQDDGSASGGHAARDYVTMTIAGQAFGIPVLAVRDVLAAQRITRVPLAHPEIAGSLNLRGRIATAVDMRRRLGMTPKESFDATMSVVVEWEGELYSLVVDEVGDVLRVAGDAHEPNPVTLDPSWRDISAGLCRLEDKLLVILQVDRLIGALASKTA